jgi:hypothetical protein
VTLRQIPQRINWTAPFSDFEMELWPPYRSCFPHFGNGLATPNPLARANQQSRIMRISGDEIARMFNEDKIAKSP